MSRCTPATTAIRKKQPITGIGQVPATVTSHLLLFCIPAHSRPLRAKISLQRAAQYMWQPVWAGTVTVIDCIFMNLPMEISIETVSSRNNPFFPTG
jgi:hypothetical protein